ncbi:MAG: M14 family zinc carboxypeptidase [Solirubrobacterales bacterium]
MSIPGRKRRRVGGALGAALAIAAVLLSASSATAAPVATSDEAYSVLGRVFPDPLAGCQNLGTSPCSPNAQGNFPATQFIQFPEFEEALEYMNGKPEWARYLEVWPLSTGQFPGNNLPGGPEFTPAAEYKSAGIPTSELERKKSDLYVLRVTDETVPDDQKKRYTLSLSIHGIERAGAEGGTRAMEDLVTAATTGKDDDTIIPTEIDPNAPSFADVLKKTIIYFTYPNPDGWRRGDLSEGGFFYQRYNGNGVDPNRDWPDIGYSFRPYSGQSEPETRAFSDFYDDVRQHGGFAAGDDLHGQVFADALSYTLLPHGRHDYAKDQRIREAAKTIHAVSEGALSWSPYIQPNDAPQGGGLPCVDPVGLGDACAQIYGQTWGTVYDTINYTTTGTLGDWFDSREGLNADGIDNEMSFSHLDRNVVFDPHGEQLHVDGNKALIYAHLAEIVNPPTDTTFDAAGHKGYVANARLTRQEQVLQPDDSGQDPQGPISMGPKPQTAEQTIYDAADGFQVNQGNGGMRVQVTMANLQGVAPSYQPNGNQVTLDVECRGCDDHFHAPGTEDPDAWTLVASDFNQQQLYQSAGLTATVNRPDAIKADGSPVEWRLVIGGLHGATKAEIEFTRGPASSDGNTGGDEPPRLAAYDVANTDFFSELDNYTRAAEGFDAVDPRQVLDGGQDLGQLDSLTLADNPLPGYTGQFGAPPSGQPPADIQIESQQPTAPAAHDPSTDQELSEPRARVPGSFERVDFEIGADQTAKSMTAEITLADPESGDFDLYLYTVNEDGSETFLSSSTTSGSHETITLATPKPGAYRLYVDNWLAVSDTHWTGAITFEPYPADASDTGAYSKAEKDAWMAELREFVQGGGNLVLTDGALLALPDLVPALQRTDVAKQTVYVGQVAFSDGAGDTTGDPLAADVEQPGARFNGGMRRQTFEPTPLGFAIQDQSGADESNAPQYSVDRAAWEAAGGRYVAGSANSATRTAQAVTDRAAVGELELGQGRIRIIGALLPQPSQAFDHPLGIEPYAVTYTGYILARNLLDWDAPGERGGLGRDGNGGDGNGGGQTPVSGGGGTPGAGGPGASRPRPAAKKKKAKCKKRGKKRAGKRGKKRAGKAGKKRGKRGKKCKGKGKSKRKRRARR